MPTSSALSFGRRTGRILLATCLLAVAVPAGFAIGTDGAAYAQSRGRGGGGGSGGSDGGGNGGNSALRCLGPTCINLNKAPPCTANYCEPKIQKVERVESCEVQVCDTISGEKICWIERAYDLRKCRQVEKRL